MTSVADEKDAIREVMARYCHALDACNFDEVALSSQRTENGPLRYGSAHGCAQIEALLASVVPKPGEGTQRKHTSRNIIIKSG